MVVRTRSLVAAVIFTLVAGCDSPATCTDCKGVGGPELTCPANVTVTGAAASGQAVTYAGPVETGGTPPVTTSCVPASGSVFPVGTTSVGCSAHDALGRAAVCSFNVTLTSSHLGAMSFLAFGDSITAGENGDAGNDPEIAFCLATSSLAAARTVQARPAVIDVAHNYPTQLLGMLSSRFPGESFSLDNEGLRGETAANGRDRLQNCALGHSHPNVLLLLEGINDIALAATSWEPTAVERKDIVDDLTTDAQNAIRSGVAFVFISTILPVETCPNTENCRVPDGSTANTYIDLTNALILSGIGGATVVDGNGAFRAAPSLDALLADDGLHPSTAGYNVLAQAFMNAIVSHIPVTSLHRVRR